MTTDVYNLLTAAQDIIRDPEHWTQGTYARTEGGHPCGAEEGFCFCSIGALIKAADGDDLVRQQGRLFLYRAVNLISGEMGIAGFNDHNTHEEVMAAWDKARELALA